MPEAFKEKFNILTITKLADEIEKQYSSFKTAAFKKAALNSLDSLELKERSNQIMNALVTFMPKDFFEACTIVEKALAKPSLDETIQFESKDDGIAGWILMPVSDYVTLVCLQEAWQGNEKRYTRAFEILHACTQRFSAEFAIRPFIRDYPDETLRQLTKWAKDPNVHVRRLVSEGSRPYLPWGLRLHDVVKNPSLVLPLLEMLKNDESEYVRRSVANNLNDIAKDHPDLIAQIANEWWVEQSKTMTKLIKHACRTLLKNGHPDVLAIFGYPPALLSNIDLSVSNMSVVIGANQDITLTLESKHTKPQNLLIDYAVHHQKANGTLSPKVFKWTSFTLAPKQSKTLKKVHSFKPVTTRKYYAGAHKVEVLINGKSFGFVDFELMV